MKADPQFTHDCLKCSYLGRDIDLDNAEIDVYVCATANGNSIVGRYGDIGHEYISVPGWVWMGRDPGDLPTWVLTAIKRVMQKGKKITKK